MNHTGGTALSSAMVTARSEESTCVNVILPDDGHEHVRDAVGKNIKWLRNQLAGSMNLDDAWVDGQLVWDERILKQGDIVVFI